ncbi:MAG: hypothetical protein IPO64_14900 [Bacteroidetes bacterium]|nr:hypothetical protein [Bacteroidota bacterium]
MLENKPDYIKGMIQRDYLLATMVDTRNYSNTTTPQNEISLEKKGHWGRKDGFRSWLPVNEMFLQKNRMKILDPNDSNTYNPFKWDVTINRISKKQ